MADEEGVATQQADADGAARPLRRLLERISNFTSRRSRTDTFQLARFFSITSLVTILIAAVILSWMYSIIAVKDLQHQGELHNRVLTQAFANAIWPQIKYFLSNDEEHLVRGRRHTENVLQYKTLHDSIRKLINDTPVLKIEIYDLNGRIVYSINEQDVGTLMPSSYPGRETGRSGEISSRIERYEFFDSINGVLRDRWILRSYLPMRSPLDDEIKGVFEINSDVTNLYDRIASSRNRFALAVTGIFGTIYLILFILVRHADMVIRRQASEREKYLDKIKQINANLDRTAKELAIAHDEAVEANSSKSQFLANMSHELRTPLNAIIGYSEMLVEDLEPRQEDEVVADLRKIQNAGKHLLAVINEILDLSKIEAGRVELHIESFDIFDAVHGVAATIQPLATKNGNNFELDCPDSLGSMNSDLTRLRQILFNLLSNASKFTHDGRILLQVIREGKADNQYILFIVEDTGIGISQEQLTRIFEPFRQADASTTREYGGTGLGLTISKRFCEMLGGSIIVESTPGEGTRFIAKLPVEAPAPGAEGNPRPRLSGPVSDQYAPSILSEDRRKRTSRVLIIDADRDAAQQLRSCLAQLAFDTRMAHSRQEALQQLRGSLPDIIILDDLPEDSEDWQLLREIRGDETLNNVPVIVCSARKDQGLAYELGASEYLELPLESEQLVNTVRKWVRTREARLAAFEG